MSRDYKPKPSAERSKKSSKGSPFFSGLLIGFLLGVAASLAVVIFVKGGESPFTVPVQSKKPLADQIVENMNKSSSEKNATDKIEPIAQTAEEEDKTRFDFYTILPGSESKVSPQDLSIKEEQPQPTPIYSYYLQVGAFQTEEEADNMKAKLALQGFEALVQTATIPDKGIWHRVRVGPLKDLDQINKTKEELTNSGFKADLIKISAEN